ncbi:VWA domain-containing protein [Taibaiella lutea]|uniref:VWA domain-containing protein n=1 Tax=Taibaiella lutea TaxID=2608001 RepID=A0A5M6CJH1_9BACT|nr:VWA domain-containing protein [Taibaiella lutea]KAA5533259.1 VWA domain-containing protein [Taibaiella lutea]
MKNAFQLKLNCKHYLSIIIIAWTFLFSNISSAQQEVQKPARILFLLDASSSMGNSWTDAASRFQTAGRIINTIVDSIHRVNTDVAFAIRVFGNQYPSQEKNCFDSKLEVPFNLANDGQIRARLKYLNPRGYSPIAWSLQQAAELDFKEDNLYSYSIILITDGGESCGGDICATVTNLLNKKISFKPYILSLIDYEPLKLEYACLGKYITVSTEKDILPAVSTILNDNRKVLMIKTSDYHPVVINTPPPKAQNVTILPPKNTPKPTPKIEPLITTEVPEKKPEPVVPPVVNRKTYPPLDLIYTRSKLQKMNLLYTIADANPVIVPRLKPMKITVPGMPDVFPQTPVANSSTPKAPNKVVEPTVAIQKPKTNATVKKAENKEDINLPFQSTTVDSKESSVQIYFTNGKGKFYRTEPKLLFKDSKTKADVKSVYRNLEGGEPAPIKMDPGTYDLAIVGSKGKANNIVIEPGKNKKVYITVGSGSLEFYYPSAPNRPVKEYRALVSKRFEPGPVVKQNCDTVLPYEPANYHIEINTLPQMMLNVDLDFYSVKVMSIPEAGTVQITNTNNKGKVQFWYQHGDAYEPFYEMNVTGNAAAQKIDFLPGLYQVRYFNGPQTSLSKADVVLFRVKSNMITNLELP